MWSSLGTVTIGLIAFWPKSRGGEELGSGMLRLILGRMHWLLIIIQLFCEEVGGQNNGSHPRSRWELVLRLEVRRHHCDREMKHLVWTVTV